MRRGFVPARFMLRPLRVYSRGISIRGIVMPLRKLPLVLCASLLAASAAGKPAAPTTSYLLKADRVFDARSEQAHPGWAVLVQGDKIAAVGPADQIKAPADAQVIEMPGA